MLELRGDEALVVFSSARGMLRAGLALQRAYVATTIEHPDLPLPVGIGMDGGEAVEVEGGYRGAALNIAARLCSLAAAGEVLTSVEVTHLAGRLEGVSQRSRGRQRVKGVDDPVTVVELRDVDADVARVREFRAVVTASMANGNHKGLSKGWIAAAVVSAVGLASLGGYVAARTISAGPSTIPGGGVTAIDARSGRILGSVTLGEQPGAIAYGAGSVWVADAGSGIVYRVDPTTRQVIDRIQVGGAPAGLAVADGLVWVTVQSGRSVAQINPDVDTVVDRSPVGNEPVGIAAGPSGVWVANSADATVTRLDPSTGSATKSVAVGGDPTGVSVTSNAVWVSDRRDDAVTAVNPKSGTRQTFQVGSQPVGVSATDGRVWVANSLSNDISQLDPVKGLIESFPVAGSPESVVATQDGGVWVTEPDAARVVRIDPSAGRVDRAIPVAGTPHGVVAVGGTLWVTTAVSGENHRGGTLVVMSDSIPSGRAASLDPAVVYNAPLLRVLLMTSDGLVDYERASGAAGGTLVPDLAARIPLAEDGGKTYTFQLRPGIKYSNGQPLVASDVQRGLEREFRIMPAPVAYYYSHLVGAAECMAHRQHAYSKVSESVATAARSGDVQAQLKLPTPQCDLSRGIETNDQAGTVTFHLTSRDPDFLYKLALQFADAVPAGTPPHMVRGAIAGTGPYQVSQFTPGRSIVLTRNPNFVQWSRAAQPEGYPDEIVFTPGTPQEALSRVLSGSADVTDYEPADQLGMVKAKYPAQLHTGQAPYLQYLSLDQTHPPFDHLHARQAFATVVDRRRWVKLVGDEEPTCQVLPPATQGYSPHCPSSRGMWRRAHRLVKLSHTNGDPVSVIWPKGVPGGGYVGTLLERLGYHVHLQFESFSGDYFSLAFKRDVSEQGWAADYPSPSGYLDIMLGCQYATDSASGFNVGHYCSHRLDAAIRHAQNLQVSQPALAGHAWARADRLAVSAAALIPMGMSQDVVVTSARAHNYQAQPAYGIILDQLWLQ